MCDGPGLTREDVTADTDFRRQLNVGEEESAEQLGEGTAPKPSVDRIEDELVTTVRISTGC